MKKYLSSTIYLNEIKTKTRLFIFPFFSFFVEYNSGFAFECLLMIDVEEEESFCWEDSESADSSKSPSEFYDLKSLDSSISSSSINYLDEDESFVLNNLPLFLTFFQIQFLLFCRFWAKFLGLNWKMPIKFFFWKKPWWWNDILHYWTVPCHAFIFSIVTVSEKPG